MCQSHRVFYARPAFCPARSGKLYSFVPPQRPSSIAASKHRNDYTTPVRALIFANGELPSRALIDSLRRQADLVVAADGGVDHALAAGIGVDAVVGDLDSASEASRQALPAGHFHHLPDPNATDLQKAIGYCVDKGCEAIDVVAAGGGRADHALANLSVLSMFRGRAAIRIVDDLFDVSLVDGSATFDAPAGTVVSLVAIGPCHGVTTSGLRWNLLHADLGFSPLGVHNEVARPPASVSVESGDLLLFKGRWVEKHG